jgi:hypothetical protein
VKVCSLPQPATATVANRKAAARAWISRLHRTGAEAGILGRPMCMQCVGYAATAVGAAGGLRSWLAARQPAWLTARTLRLATAALLTLAVLAAGIRT